MKHLFLAMLMGMPCFLNAQNQAKGVQWTENLTWDQIKQKARAENKYIFVDAYTTWCLPCKKMDKEVYTNVEVAREINKDFIAVRIQMDKTEKDNQQVKSWYPVVNMLNDQYGVDGYPSFFFFSSDGNLSHRGIGFQDTLRFVALVKEALTDPLARYQAAIKKYKAGELSFAAMPQIAREAWDKKDKKIAVGIVKEYKTKYVDRLNKQDAFTKENLSLLGEFSTEVLSSKDRYFKFFKEHSSLADSIVNWTSDGQLRQVARRFVLSIIRKEEITDKIYKNSKPITNINPKWDKIQNSIRKKYGQEYVDIFFPDEQISFYELKKEWSTYAKYINDKIKKIPPKAGGKLFGGLFGDAWKLNWYSWTVFEKCMDKDILEKAISWIDLSLQLEEREYSLDTKANLLYKLGRVSEAIALEEKAVILSKNGKGTIETLQKMKEGIPTWQLND